MLFSALASGDKLQIVVTIVAAAFLILVSIPLHEAAHSWVAYKLGDKSQKAQGRLTLNPFVHIDPVGAFMIVLVGFGWGRPASIDSRKFKDPKKGLAIVSLCGPLSNLLTGWLFIFIETAIVYLAPNLILLDIGKAIVIFLQICAEISIWLGVLNLLPIPMFDGFNILSAFLPPETEIKIAEKQGIISIVIIILLFAGILTKPIEFISSFVIKFFYILSALPFKLF